MLRGNKALKCLFFSVGGVHVAGDVDVQYTVTVEQSRRPKPWATGWPGWVSLEGEGALAQSPGPAGVSGSGLGHSGPRTPGGFPS